MPHNVAADAADRAPSTASAIGVAAPGAWPLRWTRAAVLAAAKSAPSCKESFIFKLRGQGPGLVNVLWAEVQNDKFLIRHATHPRDR